MGSREGKKRQKLRVGEGEKEEDDEKEEEGRRVKRRRGKKGLKPTSSWLLLGALPQGIL